MDESCVNQNNYESLDKLELQNHVVDLSFHQKRVMMNELKANMNGLTLFGQIIRVHGNSPLKFDGKIYNRFGLALYDGAGILKIS